MDFLYFTAAFMLAVSALLSLGIYRLKRELLPAAWFVAAFASLSLVAIFFVVWLLLPAVGIMAVGLSIGQFVFAVAVFEAGRRLIFRKRQRWVAFVAYLPAVLASGILHFAGGMEPGAALMVGFAFPGCILSGMGLWKVRVGEGASPRAVAGFRIAAAGLFSMGSFLLVRQGVVGMDAVLAYYYGTEAIFSIWLLLSIFLVTVGLWAGMCRLLRSLEVTSNSHQWLVATCRRRAVVSLALVFLLGAIFTDFLGRRELSERQNALFQQIHLLGDQLDEHLFHLSSPTLNVPDERLMQGFVQRVTRFLDSIPQARRVFVAEQNRRKEIVLLAGVNAGSGNVVQASRETIPEGFLAACWDEVIEGRPCVSRPRLDDGDLLVSALVPVPHPHRRDYLGLSVDLPADFWLQSIKQARLVGIFVTVLVLAFLLAGLVAWHLYHNADRGLRSVQERLELALRATKMATWEWDLVAQILTTDGSWSELLGLGPREKMGRLSDFLEFLSGEEAAKLQAQVQAHLRGDIDFISTEFLLQREDAAEADWLEFQGRVTKRDHSGNPLMISGILRSLKEQRMMQRELRESREKFRSLFEDSPAGIFAFEEKSGRLLEINNAFCELLKYSQEEIRRLSTWELVPENSWKEERLTLASIAPRQTFGPLEKEMVSRDGRVIPVFIQGTRISDQGEETVILATVQDLQKIKEAEKELTRTREIYRTVVEGLSEIVCQTDLDGHFTFLNSAWEKVVGNRLEDSIGKKFVEWLHPDEAARQRALFEDLLHLRIPEIRTLARYRRIDGTYRVLDVVGRLLRDSAGRIVGTTCTLRDVTEERATSRILQAVASLNSILITLRLENEGWNEPLELLGQSTNVDRVYIFRDHTCPATGRRLMSQLAEWNSGDAEPQINNPVLQNIDYIESGFADWMEQLPEGKEINYPISEMDSPGREFMQAQDIASVLVMPIFAGKEYFGFIGFDECFAPREWNPGELALLRSAAGAIGLRLSRQADEDALKEASARAEESARQAAAANQAKSAFLATMSHEIRTPLNAVIGMASLLQESSLTPLQTEYAGTVLNASNTLLDLINDVLDYSKIESGYLELAKEEFLLEELILEPLEIVSRTALQKGLVLSFYISPSAPRKLIGDRVRLKQVLLNLVSNSVKFTTSGEVSLVVECETSKEGVWKLRFHIRDTGIGISEDVLPRLFQPFLQGDSSITRRFGGTGLGLAISRKLVVLMGGDIAVESKSGSGTHFSFELSFREAPNGGPAKASATSPLRKKSVLLCLGSSTRQRHVADLLAFHGMNVLKMSTLREAAQQLGRNKDVDFFLADYPGPGDAGAQWLQDVLLLPPTQPPFKILFNLPVEFIRSEGASFPCTSLTSPVSSAHLISSLCKQLSTANAQPPSASNGADSLPAALRVLVAEDNPNNQKVIQLLLRKCGCSPMMVENGQLAVDAVAREPFDLVILDLQMPVMDGLTAVGEIRQILPPGNPTILMALTANAFAEDRDSCLKAGFDRYASKPISLPQLKEILAQVVNELHFRKTQNS